jgi:hypothetical protein
MAELLTKWRPFCGSAYLKRPFCLDGTQPRRLRCTIAGIAPGPGDVCDLPFGQQETMFQADDCAAVNGEYILDGDRWQRCRRLLGGGVQSYAYWRYVAETPLEPNIELRVSYSGTKARSARFLAWRPRTKAVPAGQVAAANDVYLYSWPDLGSVQIDCQTLVELFNPQPLSWPAIGYTRYYCWMTGTWMWMNCSAAAVVVTLENIGPTGE